MNLSRLLGFKNPLSLGDFLWDRLVTASVDVLVVSAIIAIVIAAF
jgi:hypothetical protein